MWASTQVGPEAAARGAAGEAGEHTIAVLGAGIAGLVAAYELESRGHRVTVYEGSERIGGRIYTHRFGSAPDAPYAELGAMRIPPGHALTLAYVDRLGLGPALRPFHTILSDENNYLSTSGGFVRVRDAAGPLAADLRRTLPLDGYRRATVLFGAWLTAAVRAIGPAGLRDGFAAAELPVLLRLADRADLAPYVRGPRADRIDLGAVFRDHPELRAECSPRLQGFLDDLLLETGTGLTCLAGGMGRLTDRLAGRLRGPILLGRELTALDAGHDRVRLTLRHGRHGMVRRHPAAVCTLPFSVLRGLGLTGLDADKRAVIESVEYAAATKIALHCREAFWTREGIRGGASATGGRTRQTYYPPPSGDPAKGAALLGSYAIAEDADLLGQFPEQARHAALVDELAPLHPELKEPGAVLGAASIAWGSHRWSNGCTSLRWALGGDTARRAEERRRAARPQGRLFFAGEHCSTTPAWINGAIESALGAVAAVDATLRVAR
ncbi:flavin monoamine oxidase family protein [Streptomyces hoynatensis]|uniref:FAD-dependent oxidoreductase n=1 Tax=Streptomyces hoynatensis TaxID=1141874 RepID=A0A3A9ZC79_9ACTN|nr:NAD(P)/FAD-dependent oxidoreductase [Streptomyces hoynatensis]RKN45878.1 FAD-dependent oxidoreductase [Streptomyces hoynatensis]